jgi:hypothetical protein
VLKQELVKKDQKIILMQDKFLNEKSLLLGELKELRKRMKTENKDSKQNN